MLWHNFEYASISHNIHYIYTLVWKIPVYSSLLITWLIITSVAFHVVFDTVFHGRFQLFYTYEQMANALNMKFFDWPDIICACDAQS